MVSFSSEVSKHISKWLEGLSSKYEDEVKAKASSIVSKSLREIEVHNVENFIPYGEYKALESLIMQLKAEYKDRYHTPRSYLVVLYGPPGTGKTSWVRNAVKRCLVERGDLMGVYLEVSPGDLQSKWAGVPVNTLKAIFDCIYTRDVMSVVLFDEADGIFMKPRNVDSGLSLEWSALFSEAKSNLSFISYGGAPALIVLTTNSKDAIAGSDPALADRVTAWIEVPPPPFEVKEKVVIKSLAKAFRNIWSFTSALGLINIIRAHRYNSPTFLFNPECCTCDFRWVLPSLPIDADYMIAYLSGWGWNPILDKSLHSIFDVSFNDILGLWREDNPIHRAYARGIMTEIEMARIHAEEVHKTEKSFLRTFTTLKRGIEDAERLYTDVYVKALDIILEPLESNERKIDALYDMGVTPPKWGTDNEAIDSLIKNFSGDLVTGLYTHPFSPAILHVLLSRYVFSKEFTQIVNDAYSMLSLISYGLKHLFLPVLLASSPDVTESVTSLRYRLQHYNKFIKHQLLEGELLKPLRIMFTESDGEKAWREAVKSLDEISQDLRPYIALTLVPLKFLHPALHTDSLEEKAKVILSTYRDREAYEEKAWSVVKDLGIEEWTYTILGPHLMAGVHVIEDGMCVIEASTIYSDSQNCFGRNVYQPRNFLNRLERISTGIRRRSQKIAEEMWMNENCISS